MVRLPCMRFCKECCCFVIETDILFFQAQDSSVAFNQDWQWAALSGYTSLLHENLQWLELYDSPAKSSFQSPQLYSRGGGAYHGVDVPLIIQQSSNGGMVGAFPTYAEDP